MSKNDFFLFYKSIYDGVYNYKALDSNYSQSKLKGHVQFVQKVIFEPLMDFKQNHYGSWKYYKSYTFKSFLHLSDKNTQSLFFMTGFFNIFMRKTLTYNFWGLHKNMNCALPLSYLNPTTRFKESA